MVDTTGIPTLHTERLVLRGHHMSDFDDYAGMFADPDTVQFLGGVPFTREQTWLRFLRQAGLWHHLGFGFWAIEYRQTGVMIGECGFHDLQRGLTPTLDGSMECGWGLASAWHGQGLAQEAMQACLNWAETGGTRDRLTAIIAPANTPSLRLAAKLGFVEFGRDTYHDAPVILLERKRLP